MSNMGVLRKTRRWVLPVAALILATGSTAASAAGHVEQKGKRTEAALAAPAAPIEPFPTCPNYGCKQLRIGAENDADLDGFNDAGATTDNSNIPQLNDEDGIPAGTKIFSNHPALTVAITNTTGLPAVLAGWLDIDRSGKFDADERATISLAASATSAQLTWPVFTLAQTALALDQLAATGTYLRPYLLLGVGMVLLGVVILILALMMGPKKERRRI